MRAWTCWKVAGLGIAAFLSVAEAEPPAGKHFFGVPLPPEEKGLPSAPSGLPPTAPPPAPSPVGDITVAQLVGTKWRLPGKRVFVLKPGGELRSQWHKHAGTWKITGPNTLDLVISTREGRLDKGTANASLSEISMAIGTTGRTEIAQRVND